jgi:DNA-binding GntR family transcriptional regulator
MMVETPAARLLAERKKDKAMLARLRTALDEEAAVMDDPTALTRAEGRFHQLIVELTGNDTLLMLSAVANRIIAEQVKKSMKGGNGNSSRRYKEAHRAHERLVELIEAGKADEAQALWRKHLEGGFAHLSGGGKKSESVLDLMS